jgi:hypothetical protein
MPSGDGSPVLNMRHLMDSDGMVLSTTDAAQMAQAQNHLEARANDRKIDQTTN